MNVYEMYQAILDHFEDAICINLDTGEEYKTLEELPVSFAELPVSVAERNEIHAKFRRGEIRDE